jgi:hypothetical protein
VLTTVLSPSLHVSLKMRRPLPSSWIRSVPAAVLAPLHPSSAVQYAVLYEDQFSVTHPPGASSEGEATKDIRKSHSSPPHPPSASADKASKLKRSHIARMVVSAQSIELPW